MTDPAQRSLKIWTIGHGLMPFAALQKLLVLHRIGAVADVRTTPASNRAPQFNKRDLDRSLAVIGVAYVPLGNELGGRPPENQFYDDEGFVLYRPLSRSPRFVSGIERLERGAERFRLAILCSESDPTKCHRNLLVGRAMRERGHDVTHILPGGKTRPFDDHLITGVGLPGLEEDQWKSLVQVRQGLPQSSSFDA